MNQNKEKRAWVTASARIRGDNFDTPRYNETWMNEVQLLSIQHYSEYEHFVLLRDFQSTNHLLKELFGLTSYTQVAFLAKNVFLSDNSADQVFDDCPTNYCASHNHRIVVVRPNAQVVAIMKDERSSIFLHDHLQQLDEEKYDSCYVTKMCREARKDEFAECMNDGQTSIANTDCSGESSYMREPLCTREHAVHTDRSLCQVETLQRFQALSIRANPCAVGGQSEKSCETLTSECHWCGDFSRCIPRSHDCHIRMQSPIDEDGSDTATVTVVRTILDGLLFLSLAYLLTSFLRPGMVESILICLTVGLGVLLLSKEICVVRTRK